MRSNVPLELELRVVGHRSDVDERGSPFTLFQIRIVADGLSWVVERRFSEFKKLDGLVRQRAIEHLGGNKDASALPPTLPSSILSSGFFTSSVNAEFVKRRVAGLQARTRLHPRASSIAAVMSFVPETHAPHALACAPRALAGPPAGADQARGDRQAAAARVLRRRRQRAS